MGQFTEACSSFEYIMQEKPDFNTGKVPVVSLLYGYSTSLSQDFFER